MQARECIICHNMFTPASKLHPHQKCCSYACTRKNSQDNSREWHQRNKEANRLYGKRYYEKVTSNVRPYVYLILFTDGHFYLGSSRVPLDLRVQQHLKDAKSAVGRHAKQSEALDQRLHASKIATFNTEKEASEAEVRWLEIVVVSPFCLNTQVRGRGSDLLSR